MATDYWFVKPGMEYMVSEAEAAFSRRGIGGVRNALVGQKLRMVEFPLNAVGSRFERWNGEGWEPHVMAENTFIGGCHIEAMAGHESGPIFENEISVDLGGGSWSPDDDRGADGPYDNPPDRHHGP